jgi:hypothetical protein
MCSLWFIPLLSHRYEQLLLLKKDSAWPSTAENGVYGYIWRVLKVLSAFLLYGESFFVTLKIFQPIYREWFYTWNIGCAVWLWQLTSNTHTFFGFYSITWNQRMNLFCIGCCLIYRNFHITRKVLIYISSVLLMVSIFCRALSLLFEKLLLLYRLFGFCTFIDIKDFMFSIKYSVLVS